MLEWSREDVHGRVAVHDFGIGVLAVPCAEAYVSVEEGYHGVDVDREKATSLGLAQDSIYRAHPPERHDDRPFPRIVHPVPRVPGAPPPRVTLFQIKER